MSGSAASDQADQEEYEDRMMGAGPSQPQQGLPMAQADTPTPQQLSQQPSPYANTPDPYQQPQQQAIPTGGTIDQNQFEDPQHKLWSALIQSGPLRRDPAWIFDNQWNMPVREKSISRFDQFSQCNVSCRISSLLRLDRSTGPPSWLESIVRFQTRV